MGVVVCCGEGVLGLIGGVWLGFKGGERFFI